jgi:hypothetical protein
VPSGYRGGAKNPKLSALWLVDPTQAAEICARAIRAYEGDVLHAAQALDVSRTTLIRWIEEEPTEPRAKESAKDFQARIRAHADLRNALEVARREARERNASERYGR